METIISKKKNKKKNLPGYQQWMARNCCKNGMANKFTLV
jgi:hypothetical protein